jgi:hypothetical protein
MAKIRPCSIADLPEVAALFGDVFRNEHPEAEVASQFRRLYFESPWATADIPSLVYCDGGEILGFLGVMPRAMRYRGEPLRMAVTSNFMVKPKAKAPMAAALLLRQHFQGAQDLSLAESPGPVRRFWQSMGGVTVPAYSLQWVRPLRVGRYAATLVGRRNRWAGECARPLAMLADRAALRFGLGAYRNLLGSYPDQPCDSAMHHAVLERQAGGYDLFPEYTTESLEWTWRVLERQQPWHGQLVRRVVSGEAEPAGLYAYHGNPGGTGEVVQFAAAPFHARQVFAHMLHDAERRGLSGLAGAVNPQFLDMLEDRLCFLRRHGAWTLVHSRRPDLTSAFFHGQAFLSRMEDEWMFFKLAA